VAEPVLVHHQQRSRKFHRSDGLRSRVSDLAERGRSRIEAGGSDAADGVALGKDADQLFLVHDKHRADLAFPHQSRSFGNARLRRRDDELARLDDTADR
jgi:hypothetical protein